VHFVDRLTRVRRQAIGIEIGPTLFVRRLVELKAPLEAALRFERSNRVASLPSTAKSGPFIGGCNDVLMQLEIDGKGLEGAIEREIKRLPA
jgi:hypothetical protein